MTGLAKRNVYTCNKCAGRVVTVDVDEGVTPFMIGCRAHPDDAKLLAEEDFETLDGRRQLHKLVQCDGMMTSAFYPKNIPESMLPTWEWYKPNSEQYAKLSPIMRSDHVDRGGLLLRLVKATTPSLATDATNT